LPDDALDQEILDYALSIERVAFEYYVYLLGLHRKVQLKALLGYLAREKQRRIKLLERRWAELFSVL
jgi:rubrerythrin